MFATGQRLSTLVFCINLAHIRALTKTFQDYGVDARYLHSGTPAAERHSLITAFKAGEYPVLVNCGLFVTLCFYDYTYRLWDSNSY